MEQQVWSIQLARQSTLRHRVAGEPTEDDTHCAIEGVGRKEVVKRRRYHAEHIVRETGGARKIQTLPDLVVKLQCIDLADVILWLVL